MNILQVKSPVSEFQSRPFILPSPAHFGRLIRHELESSELERAERTGVGFGFESSGLMEAVRCYLDGSGKAMRPRLVYLVSTAANSRMEVDVSTQEYKVRYEMLPGVVSQLTAVDFFLFSVSPPFPGSCRSGLRDAPRGQPHARRRVRRCGHPEVRQNNAQWPPS